MNYLNTDDRPYSITLLREMARENGFTILDASALIELGFSPEIDTSLGYEHSRKSIEEARKDTRGLARLFAENKRLVCPAEAREEFSTTVTPYYSKVGRNDVRLRQLLAGFIRDRNAVFTNMTTVEKTLTPELRAYLDTIKRTVLRASLDYAEENPDFKKNRDVKDLGKSRLGHIGNDEIIFAKCLALSYIDAVSLITKDPDFEHLHSAVYGNLRLLTGNELPLPTNPIKIVRLKENGSIRITNPIKRIRKSASMVK